MDKANANKKRNGSDSKNPYSASRRSAWFVFRTTLLIALVVMLAFFAFLYAMDASNIYIIVTEAMTLRVECTLGEGDPNELYEYFMADFVDNDERIHDNPYSSYEIDSYDYRLEINSLGLSLFATTATMTVTERVPYITGKGTANAPSASVPEWEAGRYLVSCLNVDGRWYISDVELLEANPPDIERPTPDMSLLTTTPPSSTPSNEQTAAPETTPPETESAED